MTDPITIRRSTADDREAIRRVAALDSGRAPEGDAMVALVDGELRAVLPLDGGRPLADPFHFTADIVALLQASAERKRRPVPRRRAARLLRPRFA
jgi:hypothetical protein